MDWCDDDEDSKVAVEFKRQVTYIGITGRIGNGKDTIGGFIKDLSRAPVHLRSFAASLKDLLATIYPTLVSRTSLDTAAGKAVEIPASVEPVKLSAGKVLQICTGLDDGSLVNAIINNELFFTYYIYTIEDLFIKTDRALDKFYANRGTKYTTMRQALQYLGTECFRNTVHRTFWTLMASIRVDEELRHIRAKSYADYKAPLKTQFSKHAESTTFKLLSKGAAMLNDIGYQVVCIGPVREAPVFCFTDVRFEEEIVYLKNMNGGIIIHVTRPGVDNGGADAAHSSENELNPDDGWVDISFVNDGTLLALKDKVEAQVTRLGLAKGIFQLRNSETSAPVPVV